MSEYMKHSASCKPTSILSDFGKVNRRKALTLIGDKYKDRSFVRIVTIKDLTSRLPSESKKLYKREIITLSQVLEQNENYYCHTVTVLAAAATVAVMRRYITVTKLHAIDICSLFGVGYRAMCTAISQMSIV